MFRNKVKYETGQSRDRQLTKVYIERQYKKMDYVNLRTSDC